MPSSSTPQSAQVIVAHECPVLSAGLMTSLRRLPGCEVKLWDDACLTDTASEGPGPQIVIGDRDFVARLLAGRTGISKQRARVVILSSSPGARSTGGPGLPEGVDACLMVPCAEQEFFVLMRRLRGESMPSAVPGGLPQGALRRVLDRIEGDLSDSPALTDLADLAGLSDGHFSRAFKRSMGLPPHRYLLHRRIAAAAQLLDNSEQALSSIALSLGFSDQSQFTRQFAALTGKTPGAYRRARQSQPAQAA